MAIMPPEICSTRAITARESVSAPKDAKTTQETGLGSPEPVLNAVVMPVATSNVGSDPP